MKIEFIDVLPFEVIAMVVYAVSQYTSGNPWSAMVFHPDWQFGDDGNAYYVEVSNGN